MKIVCIYHSIDLDGWMSAAIVKHWFISSISIKSDVIHTIDFLDYNYGQSTPDLSEYDKVTMVGVSFPKDKMNSLWNRLKDDFIWIDHHISDIMENSSYRIEYDREIEFSYKGLRDTNFASCELTWKYFFPNEPMPEIVRLLGRYDCFGHKGTDEERKVLELQYGARQCINNYEEAYNYLKVEIDNPKTDLIKTIPEINKVYNYFDDGKIKESRRFPVTITGIVPFDKIDEDTHSLWEIEHTQCDWLYADTTDYFVIGNLSDREIVVFVRTVDGGWFSLGWWSGRLDVDGSLTKMLEEY